MAQPNFKKSLNSSIFLVIAVLIFSASYFRIFDDLELNALDIRFRLRPAIPASSQIAIIEIGEDTLKKLGRFPFDRSYHALIVNALSEYGAKSIMFDIFFSEQDKSDIEFEHAIRSAGNVYLPYVLEISDKPGRSPLYAKNYSVLNTEDLSKAAKSTGHINVVPDPDGKFRKIPIFIKYQGSLSQYLSFRLACDYLGFSQKDIRFFPSKYIQCGARLKIPLDKDSNCLVNYTGAWGEHYKHYSYVDILTSYTALRSGEKPVIDLNVFKGAICLIGLTAAGTADLHPNPFSSLYPALGMHADLINSIIQNRFITRASKAVNIIIIAILLALASQTALKAKPLKGLALSIALIVLHSFCCIFLFIQWGLWIDMLYPAVILILIYLTHTIWMYIGELKKKFIMENELRSAKSIQESFLPKAFPKISGLTVSAIMHTARYTGGDLYDFYEFSPEKLAVLIGDVTGKGIPASLFMSKISGAFKFIASADKRPEQVLQDLNKKLTQESSTSTFVTILYAIFDTKKNLMTFASGGHPPILYTPKGSSPKFLDVEDGLPLGIMESLYSGKEINYSSGDVFVFYTDGITDAREPSGGMYGPDRLVSIVEKNKNSSCEDILNAIEQDVRKFEPKIQQHDDLTLIVIKAA